MSGIGDTFSQLLDLYHQSRKRGEWVSLSLETREGKDNVTFSINRNPAGLPARNAGSKKWKTPSQLRRDQKRKQEYLSKKEASLDESKNLVKEKRNESDVGEVKSTLSVEPKDEIMLTEMETEDKPETNLFKVVGEFKNPKFKPFAIVEPEREVKALWELLKQDNETKEMEEIGEGSTCFEHHYEFWGTWRVKPGTSQEFLEESGNWPKGVKIIEVKQA